MAKKKPTKKKPTKNYDNYHLPVRSEQEQFELLSEDLQDAWARIRAFCLDLGDQEPIRTSHRSIMFSRKTCYAFVRPKKSFLELNFFLPRTQKSDLLKKVEAVSKTKWVHIAQIIHADQVEEPLTDWLHEAFQYSG